MMFGDLIQTQIRKIMINKTYSFLIWFYVTVIVITLISVAAYFTMKGSNDEVYKVQTIKLEKGFGYEIIINNKVFIHQEYIPSISGNKNFKTEKEALEIGNLVAAKLKQGKMPSVSSEEIKERMINTE